MKNLKLKLFVFGLAFICAGPNIMLEGQRDSTDFAGIAMLAIGGICLLVAAYLHIRDRMRQKRLSWLERLLVATATGLLVCWGLSQISPTRITPPSEEWRTENSDATIWPGIRIEERVLVPQNSSDLLNPKKGRIVFTSDNSDQGESEVLTALQTTYKGARPWIVWIGIATWILIMLPVLPTIGFWVTGIWIKPSPAKITSQFVRPREPDVELG